MQADLHASKLVLSQRRVIKEVRSLGPLLRRESRLRAFDNHSFQHEQGNHAHPEEPDGINECQSQHGLELNHFGLRKFGRILLQADLAESLSLIRLIQRREIIEC